MLFRRHNQGPWARNRAPPCRSLPEITVRKVLCRNEEIYMKKRAANMIPIITSIDRCGRGWGRSCPWNGRPWRQIAARHQLASGLKAMQKSMQSLCCLPYWWAEHIKYVYYNIQIIHIWFYMMLILHHLHSFVQYITLHCYEQYIAWFASNTELCGCENCESHGDFPQPQVASPFQYGLVSRNSEEIKTTVDLPGSARTMYL